MNKPCFLEKWEWSHSGQQMFCSGCGKWAGEHVRRTTAFAWYEAVGAEEAQG